MSSPIKILLTGSEQENNAIADHLRKKLAEDVNVVIVTTYGIDGDNSGTMIGCESQIQNFISGFEQINHGNHPGDAMRIMISDRDDDLLPEFESKNIDRRAGNDMPIWAVNWKNKKKFN